MLPCIIINVLPFASVSIIGCPTTIGATVAVGAMAGVTLVAWLVRGALASRVISAAAQNTAMASFATRILFCINWFTFLDSCITVFFLYGVLLTPVSFL